MPGEQDNQTEHHKTLTETIKESLGKTTDYLSETLNQAKETFVHTFEGAKEKLADVTTTKDDQDETHELQKDDQETKSDQEMKEKLNQPDQTTFSHDEKDNASSEDLSEGTELVSDIKDEKKLKMSPEDYNMSHNSKVPVDNTEKKLNIGDKRPIVDEKQHAKKSIYDRESEKLNQDLAREKFENVRKQKDKHKYVAKERKRGQLDIQLTSSSMDNPKDQQEQQGFMKVIIQDTQKQQKQFSKEEPVSSQTFDAKGNDLGRRIHKSNKEIVQERARQERRLLKKEFEDLLNSPKEQVKEWVDKNMERLQADKDKDPEQSRVNEQKTDLAIGAFEKQEKALKEKGDMNLAEYENMKNKQLSNYDVFRNQEGREYIEGPPRIGQDQFVRKDESNDQKEQY